MVGVIERVGKGDRERKGVWEWGVRGATNDIDEVVGILHIHDNLMFNGVLGVEIGPVRFPESKCLASSFTNKVHAIMG